MLSRYQMKRGRPASELPAGVRQDTRKHTRHVLRPDPEPVAAYLAGDLTWEQFRSRYLDTVRARYRADPAPFDHLARLARQGDLYLGCSCPTAAVPDVRRCHTWAALDFMAATYADLEVRYPPVGERT